MNKSIKRKLKKLRLERKHWMMIMLVLMVSSTFTAFMEGGTVAGQQANITIKFSDYEIYQLPVSTDGNTTILQAVGNNYYVRLDNGSLYCIRNSCNGPDGNWLAFNNQGYLISSDHVVTGGEQLYLIYNETRATSAANDLQAIINLLR